MKKKLEIDFRKKENMWYIAFVLLLIICGVIKLICIQKRPGPIIFDDELFYRRWAAEIFYEHSYTTYYTDGIYPPAYPLIISVAFLWENFYFATQIINIVLSVIGTIAVWKIIRLFADPKKCFWGVLLVSVLPWQYEYCSKMMSENMYYPVLMWSIYFFLVALFKEKIKVTQCFRLGVLFAILHLTRHITIVILPIFAALWLLGINENGRWYFELKKEKIKTGFQILAGYIIVYGLWIGYRISSGDVLPKILGLTVSGVGSESIKDYVTFQSLIVMIILYVSYLALSVLYLFPTCVFGGKECLKGKIGQRISSVGMLFAGLSIMLMIATIRHSWRSAYNYPEISYIIGRYIIYIPVLFIIFWIIIKDEIMELKNKRIIFIYQVLETIFLVLSGQILTRGRFFGLSENFLELVNTRDVFYIYYFYILIIVMSLVKGLILLLKYKWYNNITQLFMGITLLAGCIFVLNYESNEKIGVFGKLVVEYKKQFTFENVDFIIDGVPVGHLEKDMEFWTGMSDEPVKAFKVTKVEETDKTNVENYDVEIIESESLRCTYEDLYDRKGLVLYQASDTYDESPALTCEYQKRQYGLYQCPIHVDIKIDCSYPDKIICGQGFNVQEDGQSALVLQTELPEGVYDVFINNKCYSEMYINKDGVGSFLISEDVYSKPGELAIEIHFKGNGIFIMEKQQPFIIEIQDEM